MKRLFREPLLHFLLLGAGLFALYAFLHREHSEDDPQLIVVDRDRLLTFAQYRSRAFDAAQSKKALAALPPGELRKLIPDYVREEALYREAKALQLDKNDYVARLRLIQQLEFITRGFAEAQSPLTDEAIARYYRAHQDEYRVNPNVTFTHVFFSSERHGTGRALALAEEVLRELNDQHVRFDQAPEHGDHFLYQLNYVAREPEEVARDFGVELQRQLFSLSPNGRVWRGPFKSPYGFHLVLMTANEGGYLPPLAQVRARVEQDARQALLDAQFEKAIQSIVGAYRVRIEPIDGVADPPAKASS